MTWKLTPGRGDADQQRVRSASEALGQRRHNRNRPAEAEDVLGRLTNARRIDYRDDVLRGVADARVGGLGPKGAERTFGENKKTRIHWLPSGGALDRGMLGDGDDVDWRSVGHEYAAAGSRKA